MRDLETTSAAITAAETGHLVLSTLHTVNAPQTIKNHTIMSLMVQRVDIRFLPGCSGSRIILVVVIFISGSV
jgi:Tfp pilus assembly pilus retraction ATPase PilT